MLCAQVEQILAEEGEEEGGGAGDRGEQSAADLPSQDELQQRWDEVMDLLSEEDREHLEKEADGATLEEKFGMLQHVRLGSLPTIAP